ncbi:MAG: hypothetical protein ABIL58_05015 [Pseudomonadota bacterium]
MTDDRPSMSLTATTEALFEMAIGIERKAAAFYVEMAAAFRHVPDVSAFWHRLYSEELEHESILKGVYDRLPRQELSQPPDPMVAERVSDAIRLIEAFDLEQVHTLDDAYELAHDLEFSEVNAVFKLLAMAGVPPEAHSRFVVEHIERHQNRLLEFGREHGGRPWRRSIQVRRG